MRSGSQLTSILKRPSPALLVLAVFLSEPLWVCAQQRTQKPAALPAPPTLTAPHLQPTPEQFGDSMLARRRYHEAIESYRKDPQPSPDAWNKMGVSYQMMLNLKDALRCYKESLRLRPLHARTLNNLGSVYDSLGDHSQAERHYRLALKLDPTLAQAAMNLGTNLMVQNRAREGLKMYQRAAALDPDIFDGVDATVTAIAAHPERVGAINYYKAQSFAKAGITDRAIKYLRLAIDEGFTNPDTVAQDSSFVRLRESLAFQQLLADERER